MAERQKAETADLDPAIITLTRESLGQFVRRPPLTEKLLNKPPFRFLHDIITSVISTTGFMNGLFSEEQMVSENVKDREAKIAFLQRAVDMVSIVTGRPIRMKPAKTVAGQEPEKTNEFLQALAEAISKQVNNNEYVQKTLAGETSRKKHSPRTKSDSSQKVSNTKDSKSFQLEAGEHPQKHDGNTTQPEQQIGKRDHSDQKSVVTRANRDAKSENHENPKLKTEQKPEADNIHENRMAKQENMRDGRSRKHETKDVKPDGMGDKQRSGQEMSASRPEAHGSKSDKKAEHKQEYGNLEMESKRVRAPRRDAKPEKHVNSSEPQKQDSTRASDSGNGMPTGTSEKQTGNASSTRAQEHHGGSRNQDGKHVVRSNVGNPKTQEIRNTVAVKQEKGEVSVKAVEDSAQKAKQIPADKAAASVRNTDTGNSRRKALDEESDKREIVDNKVRAHDKVTARPDDRLHLRTDDRVVVKADAVHSKNEDVKADLSPASGRTNQDLTAKREVRSGRQEDKQRRIQETRIAKEVEVDSKNYFPPKTDAKIQEESASKQASDYEKTADDGYLAHKRNLRPYEQQSAQEFGDSKQHERRTRREHSRSDRNRPSLMKQEMPLDKIGTRSEHSEMLSKKEDKTFKVGKPESCKADGISLANPKTRKELEKFEIRKFEDQAFEDEQKLQSFNCSNIPVILARNEPKTEDDEDDVDEEDAEYLVREDTTMASIPVCSLDSSDESTEHGGLVKKLLKIKKGHEAFETTQRTAVEIDRSEMGVDVAKRRQRELLMQDIGKLRSSIQGFTGNVIPMVKILDYLQEDLDSMKKEMESWKLEVRTNTAALQQEQRLLESAIEPLQSQLSELEKEITEQEEKNDALKSQALQNEAKMTKIICTASLLAK